MQKSPLNVLASILFYFILYFIHSTAHTLFSHFFFLEMNGMLWFNGQYFLFLSGSFWTHS